MREIYKGPLQTDAGMFGMWDYEYYDSIVTYRDWEKYFLQEKSILQQIDAARFVPINIQSDGGFGFEARLGDETGEATLTQREEKYLVVSSETYLIKINSMVCFSGIEHVNKKIDSSNVGKYNIGKGDYEVVIHLIDWVSEPGMQKKDLKPKKGALPDFVILIHQIKKLKRNYCKDINTFPD